MRLWYSAQLPKTQYRVGRVLTLPRDETVLYIEEWVENRLAFDRPAHWVEHATFGPPFVEPAKPCSTCRPPKGRCGGATTTTASRPEKVVWPKGIAKDGDANGPARDAGRSPTAEPTSAYLMDPTRETSYFTMYNPGYRVLIGLHLAYQRFPLDRRLAGEPPRTQPPWNGQVVARGMEFGTTPFGGPMKEVVDEGSLFGVPMFRWIGGRERLTARYVAFLTEIPEGFRGVEDLQVKDGAIEITERETGKIISIKSAREW